MLDDELMHWEEGLYIQPQHLQTLQRQSVQRTAVERRLLMPFPYGIVRAELDEVALSVQGGARVQFRTLQAVMENGWVIHHGYNATIGPLQLPERVEGDGRLTVYLVVRKWQQGTPAVGSNGRMAAPMNGTPFPGEHSGGMDDASVFRLTHHPEVADENTGTDRADITTRQFDARLMAVGVADAWPDRSAWEALPVLRLIGTNPPQEDPEFVPACLHLRGSRRLLAVVEQIAQAIASKRHEIATNAAAMGNNPTRADMEQILQYQAMVEKGALLSHALKNESLSPYEAYGLCLQLLGQLVGARPLLGQHALDSAFQHTDPWPAFKAVLGAVSDAVKMDPGTARGYMMAPLGGDFGNIQACTTSDFSLVRDRGWTCVLAVASDAPEDVMRIVSSREIHVGSPNALKWVRREFYIPWTEEAGTGLAPIHREGGATRFLALTFNPRDNTWGHVLYERRLAVIYANVAGQSEVQLKFKLYMRPPRSANPSEGASNPNR